MESVKRIIYGLLFLAALFVGTLFIYQKDPGLALIFNLGCFGVLCSYLAYKKQRNTVGWFFIGAITGIVGLAIVLGIKSNNRVNE